MTFDHTSNGESIPDNMKICENSFTKKQGQYLAFIYYYSKINGRPPAEIDMQRYFKVSPPSVHRMVVELEKKNLIYRESKTARSLIVKLNFNKIPLLI